ncbi:conserved hypothetical integral membrane protein [Alkalithermobacter thermoalcaliphilus JW-YL-7 = DSM 7308]|uniref:Conserved hypothetical integral membrane protein n=1 Tax=Alkalithermobacter thermoalcaliphilus JW-YL-7 = DSM 7308 TaxID=1121328 RepID=A0A150FPF5_CLOPD|nr:putative protein family UPF0324 [[Clostridium] paradoxum JW-YL-7 = DSM 7308]SHL25995.1 conserved hypothetical integral membrane protein [[Clostridium] paradoxum JW-YL-7 = DSM 7308]
MTKIKNIFPGILFVYLISIISNIINDYLKFVINLEAITIGIVLAIIYSNALKINKIFKDGIIFVNKHLLELGIILLGFRLNFKSLIDLGPTILMLVVGFVIFVFVVSNLFSKLLRINEKLATLIGVGSSICGASAVATLAPCINADEDDLVVAISIVNFLGAIGVLIYSSVAVSLNLSQTHYGIWAGLSLHGVAHAIAAAFAMGEISGEIGTVVKMARVVMMIPVAIILSYLYSKETKKTKTRFPVYVIYFVIAGVLNSLDVIPENLTNIFSKISSTFILMAMIAMGLSVNLKSIKNKGLKSLFFASMVFLVTAVSSYFMIKVLI